MPEARAWEIMSEYRENVKAVNAVETRLQIREKEREENEDNESIKREQAGNIASTCMREAELSSVQQVRKLR